MKRVVRTTLSVDAPERGVSEGEELNTAYVDAGVGPVLILIHGGGPGASGDTSWHYNLKALSQTHRTIAIDMIGFGASAKPSTNYSHDLLVRHLQCVVDVLDLPRVRIIGHSLGGYVAAKWAVANPERVEALIIVSSGTLATAMGLDLPTDTPGRLARAKYDGTRESLARLLRAQVVDKSRVTEEIIDRRWKAALSPGASQAMRSLGHNVRLVRSKDPEVWETFTLEDDLPQAPFPVGICWGNRDSYVSSVWGEHLKRKLPASTFVEFADSGHWVQGDASEEFNELLNDCLGRI